MLRAKWKHQTITTPEEAWEMVQCYKNTTRLAAAFDTETDGLHIIYNNPFMFQWGWVTEDLQGYTYAIDLEEHERLAKQVISYWHKLVEKAPIYLAHNVKFDLHMLINWGTPYEGNNLSDTMFYIRYAHDAVTPAYGGPPLQLKAYAAQYLVGNAKQHEKELDKERSAIAKALNNQLRARLRKLNKGYTLATVDEMFKDKIFSAEQLPKDIKEEYFEWLNNDVPLWLQNAVHGLVDSKQIPYNKLNRKQLLKYAHMDIVWVLETWLQLNPAVQARETYNGIELENKLIRPLLNMERVGFESDKEYLLSCKKHMRNYIQERREVFYNLAGETLKVGQHARIKQILQTKFNVDVSNTNSAQLELLKNRLIRNKENPECIEFISILEELRTLEKWYPTYILRFLKELEQGTRLYTTINQVGTVSGRVTSDFQQFPREAIQTVTGEELFQPRKMIKAEHATVYLDFSQIELRFQALYTILVGHPDLNLCRAYMPYKCIDEHGVEFDYHNPEHLARWQETWYYSEEPNKVWTPTDVHGATTKEAFGITEDHPDYKHLRNVGKTTNFAKNYGAQYRKICEMFPERSAEECRKIDEAYYTAFPGVKQYHNYCYARADYAYTTNLFGIRYYGVSGHKLINMLVQGSAAFYLKTKILELYNYSQTMNIYTEWQMQIHDELSWAWNPKDDLNIFFKFKEIMETWDAGLIPIVADMDVSTTTWAEQGGVNTLEELQKAIHNRN